MVGRVALIALLTTSCSIIRDLDYLGTGADDAAPCPALCPDGGWCALPNTRLADVCPGGDDRACDKVISSNNSAVYDDARSRLIVFGGSAGATGHRGNEVYALSLSEGTMDRLTEPSPLDAACSNALSDGTPYPRSVFDGLTTIDGPRMLLVGGSTTCGSFVDTWTLDLDSDPPTWLARDPVAMPPGCDAGTPDSCLPDGLGPSVDYHPGQRKVYVKGHRSLWRYDIDANTYDKVRSDAPSTDHLTTGRVDPDRDLFIMAGCRDTNCTPVFGAITIDEGGSYLDENWLDRQVGCDAVINVTGPGLAYDSKRKRFVAYPGDGDTVYILDPDTVTCTAETFPGGPPPGDFSSGKQTYGRFRYAPRCDVFVTVNDIDNNGYVVRL